MLTQVHQCLLPVKVLKTLVLEALSSVKGSGALRPQSSSKTNPDKLAEESITAPVKGHWSCIID